MTNLLGELGGLLGGGRELSGGIGGGGLGVGRTLGTLGGILGVGLALGGEVVLEVHGHTSGLDGDTTLGLVGAVVGETGSTGLLVGDNTGLAHQGIRKGGLAVI